MMEKDRLGAFIDAVLAIIMTILVLELPRPETYDIAVLVTLLVLVIPNQLKNL